MRIFISIGIVILIFSGLVWFARPDDQSNSASVSAIENSALTVEKSTYDFGSISMASGMVTHQFRVKNMSTGTVTIEKVYTSCMCTTAALLIGGKQFGPFGMQGHGAIPRIDQIIKADEEAVIKIVFDPAAHGPAGVGRIQRAITIENNAGRPVELQFVALVTP